MGGLAVVVLPPHHQGIAVEAGHGELAGHRVGARIGVRVQRDQVGDELVEGGPVEAGDDVVAVAVVAEDAVAVGDQRRVPAAADGGGGDDRWAPRRVGGHNLVAVVE